ncbi:cortistatin isoform X1 [Rattus rattus]|uniref:cortistatin isoform X1 n=1 Tax=Rattus rattus TaxID=10117 RepID=UPI0013F3A241|nr:cortistatin isoform X1 [Rattus rattus]
MDVCRPQSRWYQSLKYQGGPRPQSTDFRSPRRMGGCSTRGKRPSALSLLLLLLWGIAASALPLESGPTGQDSVQDAAGGRRTGLLTFLAWWHEWASQDSSSTAFEGDTPELSKRQERPPLQQPPHRDKKPCKNFFWKTFSSCK